MFRPSFRPSLSFVLLLIGLLCLPACQSAYYKTMEKFGVHKREILVDRVQKARDSQDEAKKQFASALEQFSAVLNFKGGSLEEKYEKLNDEYEASETKAQEVRDRIQAVEDVSQALFKEWKAELKEYSNPEFRRDSEKKLRETEKRYDQLMAAMLRAERKIKPVLSAFRDHVLFLKHNLNAQAIASLQTELGSVETRVARLVKEMETAIDEADSFIKAMGKE